MTLSTNQSVMNAENKENQLTIPQQMTSDTDSTTRQNNREKK